MGPKKRGPKLKLALAQCAPVLGDVAANLRLHLSLAERAAAAGADLCVFPELSLTGYFLKDMVPEVAVELDDPQLKPLLDMSARIDLILGLALRNKDFGYHNAVVYISGGEVRHVHRKVYLPTYGMFDEQRYFAAGDRIRGFDLRGWQAGMLVCEDLWHLSTAYLMFVQGVSLLICPSVSPGRGVLADPDADHAPGSVSAWQHLLRTVAQYNICYVAYCNRLGYEDGVNFWGGSSVHGPDGHRLAWAGEEHEELIMAEVDVREVERQRLATPLPRDEKVELTLRELERIWNERTEGPF